MRRILKIYLKTQSRIIIDLRKLLILAALSIFIGACATPNPPGVPGGIPSPPSPNKSPSIPMPPTGGGSSSSDSDSSSMPPPPSSSSSDSDSEADSGEVPPGWEDDPSATADDGGDSEFEDELVFEEPLTTDDAPEGLSDEELEELEKELEESMGDFDEDIQREKTYAEERANENTNDGIGGIGEFEDYEGGSQSSRSSSSNSASQSSSSGSQSSSSSSASSSAQSSDQSSDSASEGADGGGKEVVRGEARGNDDIVARQLREAAEKETDPELKEKLWKEYYDYKNQ